MKTPRSSLAIAATLALCVLLWAPPAAGASQSDSSWRDITDTGLNGQVWAMVMVGQDLYVGGEFTTADGAIVNRIVKWDGSTWSPLGPGVNGPVRAIASYDSSIYVAGTFTQAGGQSVSNIARWDGTSWSDAGDGINGPVFSLASRGGQLFAGGDFTLAGGVSVNNIAAWNGTEWSALDQGVDCAVYALAADEWYLYAGGAFTTAGGQPAKYIARWNGANWTGLSAGMDGPVTCLAVRGNVAEGGHLYVGGQFTNAGGVAASYLARWNNFYWWPLGGGTERIVRAISAGDSVLFAGGWFMKADGDSVNYVARYDGSGWTGLDGGTDAPVSALAVAGSGVYVGGEFSATGNIPSNRIGLWDPDSSIHINPPEKLRIKLTIAAGIATRDLFFGVRAGAARGIWGVDPAAGPVDSVEGESELPPALPGTFDARFTSPAGDYPLFGGGSWVDVRDFRNITQVDTYRVDFQPGSSGYPVKVSWSPTAVQAAYLGDVSIRGVGGFAVDMKANDSILITDDLIEELIITADQPDLPVLYTAGWNLISIPNDVPDGAKSVLFPGNQGTAYSFNPVMGYQSNLVLAPGIGYWLKFPGVVHALAFDGTPLTSDTVYVHQGWNLIGAISVPVPVATVVSQPPGMVTGNFFGYDAAFEAVSILEPMRGYWVKTAMPGMLILSASPGASPLNAIRIVPDGELPPAPPSESPAGEAPAIVTAYELSNVYPNPFNPVAHITYALPVESRVVITVYNVFGQVVARLAERVDPAGIQTVEWDASAVSSGVYFCRMEATSIGDPSRSWSEARKMVLMK